ncbi:conserved hypothetical protein [Pediculus humanus corporis]|uniref:Uncharacterized protein n=1 Tax=Pediculus humanus subsp. corporis TaxID=121224 RepID=E0VRQ5_PEDHC|nr:uncharacterized protein Phum_PHUM401550 [Pediculus humanus corporis]EEB16061.1 conserved hypothetical protein [Pediculus humanus corporis]
MPSTVKCGAVDKKKEIKTNLTTKNNGAAKSVIRSTRAQDLRSQSNRDLLLKPKTTIEKTRNSQSPYVSSNLYMKKKKNSGNNTGKQSEFSSSNNNNKTITNNKSNVVVKNVVAAVVSEQEKKKKKVTTSTTMAANEKNVKTAPPPPPPPHKGKLKKGKPLTAGEKLSLQRQKTQEIINPKFVKKINDDNNDNNNLKSMYVSPNGDNEFFQLKKSQTFFICKGAKNFGDGGGGGGGDGDDDDNLKENNKIDRVNIMSEEDENDDDDDDDGGISPKLNPLTHNDSFCLIVKSSQNWSQKNRSDDEKWRQYDLSSSHDDDDDNDDDVDKGILKNSNHNLKSVDSLEKIDSEKIVRFSDEILIPVSIKEKYETDVFGLSKRTNNRHPPNNKNYTNNPCSY